MKNLLICFLSTVTISLCAQNNFTYHVGIGLEAGAFETKWVEPGTPFIKLTGTGYFPTLRASAVFNASYQNLYSVSTGISAFPMFKNLTQTFPFAEFCFTPRVSKKTRIVLGLAYEERFGVDDGRNIRPSKILSQPGYGPVIGVKFKRSRLTFKRLRYEYEYLDPYGSYNYAIRLYTIKFTRNLINLNTGKRANRVRN